MILQFSYFSLISAGYHHTLLEQNLSRIKRDLQTSVIIKEMYSEGLINKETKDDIMSESSAEEQTNMLVKWLQFTPKETYSKFIIILKRTGQHMKLARILSQGLYIIILDDLSTLILHFVTNSTYFNFDNILLESKRVLQTKGSRSEKYPASKSSLSKVLYSSLRNRCTYM